MREAPSADEFSIEINASQSAETFKSIGRLSWRNIPRLAILTGINGAGKSQLLELLAYKLTSTSYPNIDISKVHVEVDGPRFDADEVAYSPSLIKLGGRPELRLADLQDAKRKLHQDLQPNIPQTDLGKHALRRRIEKILGKPIKNVSQAEFVERMPNDFNYMVEDVDLTAGLSHVFLAHRVRIVEALERDRTEGGLAALGGAPWDLVNDVLSSAGLTYRLRNPSDTSLLAPYRLQLIDQVTGAHFGPEDLSSGEKVLLRLVLWLYNSEQHGRLPKLLLLDEPDAHLHPSMCQQFITVLRDVIVAKYGVRVIMTTHSPSTVALAPHDAIFEMQREQPRISAAPSQAHAVALLTAGLITVSPSTRFVLVEDEADVQFYNGIRSVLTEYGSTRDGCPLEPTPSLVFLPASVRQDAAKIGGGKSVVRGWVNKFNEPPLDSFVKGLIDGDDDNVGSWRVPKLRRYSIENYLLDPMVIFGLLIDQGTAPKVDGVEISQGDEHLIRELSASQLQAVVAAIAEAVLPVGDTASGNTRLVIFTNGKAVRYPVWMIAQRGKALLEHYQSKLGGPGIVSPNRLRRMFQRVRLVPVELAAVLRRLQQ